MRVIAASTSSSGVTSFERTRSACPTASIHAKSSATAGEYLPPMGIDQSKVDALLARARREVDEGLLPSTQVALAYQGELVAFEAYGDADLDTRYAAFSATKAFVASTVWTLIGEGLVDPSKLVTEYIPEFGTNGKDVITVEQVMLHTAGFPHAPLGAPDWWTRDGRVK